ncbi:LacI family DNA-binding transcriptional regulator [Tessaracoccus sp. ZS01]|uniref:LacI family DNA-binding transcriptional regulator n=1 Tax=Tessaracoccus sp. ZS01 TaxID=1906324 RepID=UPI0009700F03|nr:LacI family DNA-binding transcriptional regulator [Tessaracoccus sp. ZS01]MCG6568524.1 LacI family transcriptional regulator [Tessaracoccus sp. ZS01]OMG52701.1 LacI family transcriptional regulator [Tessaracoccus sp. ZS01]
MSSEHTGSRDGSGRRPTLADVAVAAGVSRATVSKALNGRGDIAEATRERVLTAVAALGYRSTTAPAVTSIHRALVVVFDLPASSYIMGVLNGVLDGATERGTDLLMRMAPPLESRRRHAVAREWIEDQRAVGVAGIIGLTLSQPGALIAAAGDANIPFVMVDPVDTSTRRVLRIGSSNWAGARAATEYLIGLGHRRIAWVGGPEASDAARDRLYGYRAALDRAGLDVDPDLERSGQFDPAQGAQHARELLTSPNPPTAIMAADDELAMGALATARSLGIQVPEQLSVMGFDDTAQAAWTTPPLTTVHQHLGGMGRVAVETVLAMAEGHRPASSHIELATSLTVRESTGAAPSGAGPA